MTVHELCDPALHCKSTKSMEVKGDIYRSMKFLTDLNEAYSKIRLQVLAIEPLPGMEKMYFIVYNISSKLGLEGIHNLRFLLWFPVPLTIPNQSSTPRQTTMHKYLPVVNIRTIKETKVQATTEERETYLALIARDNDTPENSLIN